MRGTAARARIRFHYDPPFDGLEVVVRGNWGATPSSLARCLIIDTTISIAAPSGDHSRLGKQHWADRDLFRPQIYRHASIVCVEPMPANFACLEQNLRLNGVPAKAYQRRLPCTTASCHGPLQPGLRPRRVRLGFAARKPAGRSPSAGDHGSHDHAETQLGPNRPAQGGHRGV